MKIYIIVLLAFCFNIAGAIAKDIVLSYPELQVVPLASARVKMEAKREQKETGIFSIPMQISGLTTLAAGLIQFTSVDKTKDPDGYSPFYGIATGLVWTGVTLALSTKFKMYKRAYRELRKMPSKSKRDRLAKERRAEEYINELGSIGRKMVWASVLTNAGASAAMFMNSKNKSIGMGASIASLVFSFAPLIFNNRWSEVDKTHRNYKKKIYSPIAFSPVVLTPSNKMTTGLSLTYSF